MRRYEEVMKKEGIQMADTPNSIQLIWSDLKHRLRTPCGSMTFYAHLGFGVILCGAVGVWTIPLRSSWHIENVSAALLGYFPALLGGAVLQFTEDSQPYLRSFAFIALFALTPVTIAAYITHHSWQLIWSFAGTILSILLWWVANGLDKRWDDVKPQSAVGGDASTPLSHQQDGGWQT